jgi:hypothetical protein
MIDNLNAIHQTFDGIIPRAVLDVAHHGSPEMVAFIRARGEVAGFRSMVIGQIEIIRKRRADGSYYPALIEDLACYVRQHRAWRRIAHELHAKVFGAIPAIRKAA